MATGAALGLVSPAFGASQDFTVNQLGDSGDGTCDSTCTLRDAVDNANANASQYDYIFLSGLSGTINLTAGEIMVTDEVYIYGPGADELTVDAASGARIFNVNPVNPGDRAFISGLTLTGGNPTGDGGAVRNEDGTLRIFGAVLSGNTAGGLGGAIYEAGTFENGNNDRFGYTTFSDNHADSGGAIYADERWGSALESTFSGNSADSGDGGAVAGAAGYLFDSTVSGNNASGSGGGVSANGGISMYGTILANNTAGAGNPDLNAFYGDVGYDLVENPGTSGIEEVESVITGQDPQLGSLQDNGGYSPTLKPAAGSPVVDQSYSSAYYDQLGRERVIDNPNRANAAPGPYGGADIGSVELTIAEGPQATPSTPAPPAQPFKPKKKRCKKKKKHHSAAAAKKKKCKKKKKRSAAASSGFHFSRPSSAGLWPQPGHNPFRLGR